MNYVLIKVDTNWADEMDIEGFLVLPEHKWGELKEKLKVALKKPVVIWVGTNEELTIDSYKDLMRKLTLEVITEEEASVLGKLFNNSTRREIDFSYAFGWILGAVLEVDIDEEEED